jgi:hypothetical protein
VLGALLNLVLGTDFGEVEANSRQDNLPLNGGPASEAMFQALLSKCRFCYPEPSGNQVASGHNFQTRTGLLPNNDWKITY